MTERRGTVFFVVDDPVEMVFERPMIDGYWDATPDAAPAMLERWGPGDIDDGIAWARARADRVLVRVDDSNHPELEPGHYWAGRPDLRPSSSDLPNRPWPGPPGPYFES